mgnify:CR=1 FL=1
MEEGSSVTDQCKGLNGYRKEVRQRISLKDLMHARKQEAGSRIIRLITNSRLPITFFPIFNGLLECNDPGPKHRKH